VGRLTLVNDSRQGTTQYAYDDANQMVKITKPGGRV
jgi:YD repeat-containing protein